MEERKTIFKTITHPTRAAIIRLLYENEKTTQDEMLKALKIGPWLLEYHLKTISELWEESNGKYMLTEKGKIAYRITKEVGDFKGSESVVVYATLLKRVLATTVDFALVAILLLFANGAYQVLAITATVVVLGTVLEWYVGKTPGKYLVKTRVISENGRKLNLKESALRNFGKLLLPLDLYAGFILFRKNGYIRALDRYAHSMVIDEEASR